MNPFKTGLRIIKLYKKINDRLYNFKNQTKFKGIDTSTAEKILNNRRDIVDRIMDSKTNAFDTVQLIEFYNGMKQG